MTCRRKTFLKRTTDGTIGYSGGNDRHLVETDRDPVPTFKECCCVFLGFVSCVLSVRNRCLSTALRKLMKLEGSLRPKMLFCLAKPGLEPETSRTATASPSHSATVSPK